LPEGAKDGTDSESQEEYDEEEEEDLEEEQEEEEEEHPIPKCLLKHKRCLEKLATRSMEDRLKILEKGDPDLIQTVCECADNILRGNLLLKPHEKEILRPYYADIRRLADPKHSLKTHQRDLVQNGAGVCLPALLSPVIDLIRDM